MNTFDLLLSEKQIDVTFLRATCAEFLYLVLYCTNILQIRIIAGLGTCTHSWHMLAKTPQQHSYNEFDN